MVFPWTTVDSVLKKFNSVAEDMDTLAARHAKDQEEYQRMADAHKALRDKAARVAKKFSQLIE